MKIEKLIQIFENCIPTYQKCVDENWDYNKIAKRNLHSGLCLFVGKRGCRKEYKDISKVFKTYYRNFLRNNFLFPSALSFYNKDEIRFCIKPRLKFLKQQVKELKKLQKQGYTHV